MFAYFNRKKSITHTVNQLTTELLQLRIELGYILPFVIGFLVLLLMLNTGQGVELISISRSAKNTFLEEFAISLPAFICGLVSASLLIDMRGEISHGQLNSGLSMLLKLRTVLIASAIPILIVFHIGIKLGFLPILILLPVSILIFQSNVVSKKMRTLITFLAIIFVILSSIVVVKYVEIAQALGTIGVVVTAITLWATLVTVFFGYLPARLLKIQSIYFVASLLFLCFAWYGSTNENYLKKAEELSGKSTETNSDAQGGKSVQEHFLSWLERTSTTIPLEKAIDVYLITAEGGGLRASAWTTAVLAALDKKTQGNFSKQAFAFSGVSGGSLGIATYVQCMQSLLTKENCNSNLIRHDYLAPAVARLLISEPFRLLPGASKLISKRDRSFEEYLENMNKVSKGEDALSKPFLEVFNITSHSMPIVVLNSVDAETGIRAYFSNVNLGYSAGIDLIDKLSKKYIVPASFAIHTSARFPIISPPAKIDDLELVDGGYRENTGANEISIILSEIHKVIDQAKVRRNEIKPVSLGFCFVWDEDCNKEQLSIARESAKQIEKSYERLEKLRPALSRVQLHVIAITNNCYTIKDCDSSPASQAAYVHDIGDITAPLKAILSSRTNRTRESIVSLKSFAVRKDNENFSMCSHKSRSTRLEKKSKTDTLVAIDGAYIAESECDSKPFRHTFHEIPLINSAIGSHPPLGWTLSNETFERINFLANKSVFEDESILNWKSMLAWWQELEIEFCLVPQKSKLYFDEKARPKCKI